jgi:tetratricopeptide (TPR) repeat protein
LGDEEQAVEHLNASVLRALDTDSPADAAQAFEGLAQVHLRRREYDKADELARKALDLLQGRDDYLHEVCPSQLVLGRALMERGRLDEAGECFRAADAAAEQLASISHRAEAWVALGDLAARRGEDREAARLYRNAAEALQEIRF